VRIVLGSGLTAEASSDGFYIDLTPPVFDKNVMTQIYIDVTQGEFTPVKYQASNDTIKAYWYCFDEESLHFSYIFLDIFPLMLQSDSVSIN
jgi:hypothetical protein